MTCWHRLGERCSCGHLTVPARFYKDATQKQAEAAYLGFLKENMPGLWEKLKPVTEVPKRYEINQTTTRIKPQPVTPEKHVTVGCCQGCGGPLPVVKRGPSPTFCSPSCRQKAYRGRHA